MGGRFWDHVWGHFKTRSADFLRLLSKIAIGIETILASVITKGGIKPCDVLYGLSMTSNALLSRKTEDQALSRTGVHMSDPHVVCCVLPNGKYVLTGPQAWRLLGCEDRSEVNR